MKIVSSHLLRSSTIFNIFTSHVSEVDSPFLGELSEARIFDKIGSKFWKIKSLAWVVSLVIPHTRWVNDLESFSKWPHKGNLIAKGYKNTIISIKY